MTRPLDHRYCKAGSTVNREIHGITGSDPRGLHSHYSDVAFGRLRGEQHSTNNKSGGEELAS